MAFEEVYFIEGQSVQGKMKIIDPFTFTPEYPDEILTYQRLPVTPLDLVSVYKDKSHDSVKEEKKKCCRNKLLKLMLIYQMMNSHK